MGTGRPSAQHIERSIARADYPPQFVAPECKVFGAVLDWHMPPPQPEAALLALFDWRADIVTIRNWRLGRTTPPQWAIDLLDKKLAAYGTEAPRAALAKLRR